MMFRDDTDASHGWSRGHVGTHKTLLRPGLQVEEKLLIACGTCNRRRCHADAVEPVRRGIGGHAREHGFVHVGIGDQAVLADIFSPSLELWLHEWDDVGVGRRNRPKSWKDMSQRNER